MSRLLFEWKVGASLCCVYHREALQQLAEHMIVVAAAFCDLPAGILARDGHSVRWFCCRQLLGAEQCRVTVTPAHNELCRVMRAQQERKMAENPPPPPPTDEGQSPPPPPPLNPPTTCA